MKAVHRGKFITLHKLEKKIDLKYISFHTGKLEKKELIESKVPRRKE